MLLVVNAAIGHLPGRIEAALLQASRQW